MFALICWLLTTGILSYLISRKVWVVALWAVFVVCVSFIGWNIPQALTSLVLLTTAIFTGALVQKRAQLKNISENRSRYEFIILGCLFSIGLSIRLYGLDFGLPAFYHPDELRKANILTDMVARDSWNPKYFLHPSLLLYGALLLSHLAQLYNDVLTLQASMVLGGRAVSICAAAASIVVLYRLGALIYARSVGLVAAFIFAVSPLAVTSARYFKEDSLLVLWMLCAIYFMSASYLNHKPKVLLLSALFIGLAIGTKYSGGLLLLPFFILSWAMSLKRQPDREFIIYCVCGIPIIFGVFFLTTPFSVIDFDTFKSGIFFEVNHMSKGHTEQISAWSQLWMYHWGRSIVPGLTVPVALIAAAGIGVMACKREKRDLIVLITLLLFYLSAEFVRSKPAPQPERYILPCIPFLCIAAARFVEVLKLRWKVATLIVIGVSLTLRTGELAHDIYNDTREQASAWIKENLPQGSKVLLDFQPYSPIIDPGIGVVVNNPYLPISDLLTPGTIRSKEVDYIVLSSLTYERFFTQPGQRVMRIRYRDIFKRYHLEREFSAHSGRYGFHNPVIRIYKVKKLLE